MHTLENLQQRLIEAVRKSNNKADRKAVMIEWIKDPLNKELPEDLELLKSSIEDVKTGALISELIFLIKAQANETDLEKLQRIERLDALLAVDKIPLPGNIISNSDKLKQVDAICITRRLVKAETMHSTSLRFISRRATTNKLCMAGVYYLVINSDIFKKGVPLHRKINFLNDHYQISYMKEFYKKETLKQAVEIVRTHVPELDRLFPEKPALAKAATMKKFQ
ncbi:MAG TPA: hypothetical protein VK212_03400 [Lentimicrobium sp.]|nr:hypothetical protein [Lentimicrobium sp.]